MRDDDFHLDDFLPYLLADLAEGVSNRLAGRYRREFGLSVPEWRVLANLHERGPLCAAEVGRCTNMYKVKVSRAVNELLAKGWISSRPNAADARVQDLALTPAGEAVMLQLVPLALDWERELLGHLPARDRAAAKRVLHALRAALAAMEEPQEERVSGRPSPRSRPAPGLP
jgi:DNA-binding MarR family transcriptional regulator